MDGVFLKPGNMSAKYLMLDNKVQLLEKTLSGPLEKIHSGDKEELKEVAAEFESFFIYYLFQRMRATIPKGGLLGESTQRDMYTSMLDEEMARKLAAGGGIGLSKMIIEQLGRSLEKR